MELKGEAWNGKERHGIERRGMELKGEAWN
jgi:hypothetical protein